MAPRSYLTGIANWVTALILASLILSGCTSEGGEKPTQTPQSLPPSDAGTQDASEPNLPEVTVEQDACTSPLVPYAVDHSCIHALRGPFLDVVAASDMGGAVDISQRHTLYNIQLLAIEGGYGGYMSFSHNQEAVFAAYPDPYFLLSTTTSDLVAQILDDYQADTTARFVEEVAPTNPQCALALAYVYPLAAVTTHTVYLFSQSQQEVTLVIEHLFDYANQTWAEECADDE